MGVVTAEFVSGTTAGVVNVELGFVPTVALVIGDHGGVPKPYVWVNNAKHANYPAARTLALLGGSAAYAPDATSLLKPYAGYETIAADQTDNSAPKHVDAQGVAAKAGRVTRAGLTVAAGVQVNSGRNLVIAWGE